jgi:glycosyltransferase involved in cell wall biosynthesis
VQDLSFLEPAGMAFDLITVCVFGRTDQDWLDRVRTTDTCGRGTEATGFDLHAFDDDSDLEAILARVRPHVLVTFGHAQQDFPRLWRAPLEVRRRWLHYDPGADPAAVAEGIMATFVTNATTRRFPDHPLVSVFTPTYLSGDKIQRPLRSLLAQSYTNWEWVVVDDSPDAGRTFAELAELARRHPQMRVFQADRPCGIIGEVKRRACGLARGEILVELDHDDELTRDCLADLVAAFQHYPEAGFAYTDCAEVSDSGENLVYPEGWGFGFGSYRTEVYDGRSYLVTNYPGLNAKTVRHIVGVPNHVRAWTRDAYFRSGGHSPEVHVCDDYELLLRTFLTTRMIHIRKFGYIQYQNRSAGGGGNAQRTRNKEIQRLVRYFRGRYEQQIHARLLELGLDDFIWRDGVLDWSTPNPPEVAGAELVYPPPRPGAEPVPEPPDVSEASNAVTAKYRVGQKVLFANQESTIVNLKEENGQVKYYVETGEARLPMWLPEASIQTGPPGPPTIFFHRRMPHLLVVDGFYKDPDAVRRFALEQEYVAAAKTYKGKRTRERFLWPGLREEFQRLLGRLIVDWLKQPANGCFQITGFADPLVWHSDVQSYAAAIYLTPEAPLGAGTSFWRDVKYHCRRPPAHPLEADRFADDAARSLATGEIYNEYNFVHPDNWELVDKVGAVYNRLVLWDAQLIHSASSYEGLHGEAADKARLVHLFFFTVF